MRRMAVHAGNTMLHVRRMVKRRLLAAALMTFQTALGILFGISVKSKDQLGGGRGFRIVPMRRFLPIRVSLACAVAHFATTNRIGVGRRKGRVPGLAKFLKLG